MEAIIFVGLPGSGKSSFYGEHVVRNVLRDLTCDLATREEIARMECYHGRPAFLLERDEPTHGVVRLSWLDDIRGELDVEPTGNQGHECHSLVISDGGADN